MSNRCVVAQFTSMRTAATGLEVLRRAGFTFDKVSVVAREDDDSLEKLDELKPAVENAPSSEKAVGLGTLIGGALAVPASMTTLIGPFILAGPLVGMAAGATVGGLLNSTSKWGVDRSKREELEEAVSHGHVLLIVTDDDIELREAYRLLQTARADSVESFAVQ